MTMKLSLLAAAAGLLSLSACGVYQDYPNDSNAIESHRGNQPHYTGKRNYGGTHPYAAHNRDHMHDGHWHHAHHGHHHDQHHAVTVDNRHGDAIVGQDKDSYMHQNEDKWMYNSCPPGAAKRGDC